MKKTQILISRESTSQRLITLSIGLIFFFFGILKFFPDYSPAEDIAKKTINVLISDLLPSNISYLLLAIWETAIGLMFILNYQRKSATILALIHLTLTFSTFFIFPELSFNKSPFSFTLLGQYIIKNIIILSVLISLLTQNTTSND
ncbi:MULTISPECIES: doxx family protein [Aestuariibaculum]|uniref:Doxx family protein n=1 Tax=Aestuariibaculum lutulentum TaxID=2920935 RepID=A0ABS9RIB7_9FLAO|nr:MULTISPECIES: doxx family protein [Aestuariibaculum]MCH4552699.1 doxx family protein [Aestuariibaculum lutulentum]MCR8668017.1 doxx family protein [Aestuariibaculum sp. M13]